MVWNVNLEYFEEACFKYTTSARNNFEIECAENETRVT